MALDADRPLGPARVLPTADARHECRRLHGHRSRAVHAEGGPARPRLGGRARLGRTGDSVTLFPTTATSIEAERFKADAPGLDYAVAFPHAGEFTVSVNLVPTHPISGPSLRFAIALDDAPPRLVALEVKDGGPDWAHGVLNATRVATTTITVPTPGAHTLRIFGVDPGVVLDRLVIGPLGHVPPGYLGPADTRKARPSK